MLYFILFALVFSITFQHTYYMQSYYFTFSKHSPPNNWCVCILNGTWLVTADTFPSKLFQTLCTHTFTKYLYTFKDCASGVKQCFIFTAKASLSVCRIHMSSRSTHKHQHIEGTDVETRARHINRGQSII